MARKRLLVERLLIAGAILAAILVIADFIVRSKAWSHKEIEPTLDLSSLHEADIFVSSENGRTCTAAIEGDNYITYLEVNERTKESIFENVEPGKVLAYFVNDDRIFYFAEIKGLDSSEWLLEFREDGTGTPDIENYECILRNEDCYRIPEWITEAKNEECAE